MAPAWWCRLSHGQISFRQVPSGCNVSFIAVAVQRVRYCYILEASGSIRAWCICFAGDYPSRVCRLTRCTRCLSRWEGLGVRRRSREYIGGLGPGGCYCLAIRLVGPHCFNYRSQRLLLALDLYPGFYTNAWAFGFGLECSYQRCWYCFHLNILVQVLYG